MHIWERAILLKTMMTHHFRETKSANQYVSMNWLETIMYKSCVLEFVDIVTHCGLYPTFLHGVNKKGNCMVKKATDDFKQFKTLLNNMLGQKNISLSTRYKNMLSTWTNSNRNATKPASALQVLYPCVNFALTKNLKNKQVKVLSKGSLFVPSGKGEGINNNFILNDSSRTKLNKLSDFAIDAAATVKTRKNGTTEQTWAIGMPANAKRLFVNTFQKGDSTDKSDECIYPITDNLMQDKVKRGQKHIVRSEQQDDKSSDQQEDESDPENANKRMRLFDPLYYLKFDKYQPNKDSNDYENIKTLFESLEVGLQEVRITRPVLAAGLGRSKISGEAWKEAREHMENDRLIAIKTSKGVVNSLHRLYSKSEESVAISQQDLKQVAKGAQTTNTLISTIYSILYGLESRNWYSNAMTAAKESLNIQSSTTYELNENVTMLIVGFGTSMKSLLLDIGCDNCA